MVKNLTSDDKTMGMLVHLLGIVIGIISPLIFFLINKDKKGFVYDNARNALNFQITMLIYGAALFVYFIISGVLVLLVVGVFMLILGWIVAIAIGIFALVVTIIGAVRAYNGEVYKYPLTINFIK